MRQPGSIRGQRKSIDRRKNFKKWAEHHVSTFDEKRAWIVGFNMGWNACIRRYGKNAKRVPDHTTKLVTIRQ